METYSKSEVMQRESFLIDAVCEGKIFIHPTDTIYGLGCDATNSESVKRLREIKGEHERPFSVIAPSKTWIRENCEVDERVIEWIKKLPGPYTLILKLKNKSAICSEANNGLDTIGVRLPDHWMETLVEHCDIPVITTTANKKGGNFMSSIETLDVDIRAKVHFFISDGTLGAKPSTIIDLTKEKESVLRP